MKILRIVKMEFQLEAVEGFYALFFEIRPRIEAMPGCQKVEMLTSADHPQLRTTLSWWTSQDDLNAYRKSALFGSIWPKTKALFANKPVAWSVDWNVADGMKLDM